MNLGARVLHVLASGGLYGVERMLLALLPELQKRSCDVQMACLSSPGGAGGEIGEALSGAGVPVHYCDAAGRLGLRALPQLRGVLRTCDPQIVHLHGYKATILAGALSLLGRTPTVATFHTEAKKAAGLSTHVALESHILRRLDAVAAVSEPIRHELEERGVRPARIRVIPNGIPDRYERHEASATTLLDGHAPLLLFVGRLVEGKNVELLIEAVARLRAEYPGIGLAIAGNGPLRPELEDRASALSVNDAVRFLGFQPDVAPLLATCDCFVLPSRTEGMPIALLEAMSFARPIVASMVGSIPSVARHEEHALLVRPDDPNQLLAALRRLLDEEPLARHLAANARKRFEREFTADRMACRYLEFYRWMRETRRNNRQQRRSFMGL